ncbi:hypothetical protein Ciccas_006452 [Cichlidogyrus casuarinus]|uniref:Uncharacterized protein n=1 Tax=Cichlidogyrus casuarinus TaxID=1844966 RepID=A0ABD2Q5W5_9PLAT
MNVSYSSNDGGIFRFAPFVQPDWAKSLILESFQEAFTIKVLALILLNIVFLVAICALLYLSHCSAMTYSKLPCRGLIWGLRMVVICLHLAALITSCVLLYKAVVPSTHLYAITMKVNSIANGWMDEAFSVLQTLANETMNVVATVLSQDVGKPQPLSNLRAMLYHASEGAVSIAFKAINFTDDAQAQANILIETLQTVIVKYLNLLDSARKMDHLAVFNLTSSYYVLKFSESLLTKRDFELSSPLAFLNDTVCLVTAKEAIVFPPDLAQFASCNSSSAFFDQNIPKVFNVESEVNGWVPAILDPSEGIKKIFAELLAPLVDTVQKNVKITLEMNLNARSVQQKINDYSAVAQQVLTLFAVLTGIFIVFELIHLIIFVSKPIHRHRQRRDSTTSYSRLFSKRQILPVTYLYIISSVFMLLFSVVTGISFYASSMFIDEACLYLKPGPLQKIADQVLNSRLPFIEQFLHQSNTVNEFWRIPNLQPRYPQNVLATLSTKYNDTPLLKSMNFEQPVNFDAVLRSVWLRDLVLDLWLNQAKMPLEKKDIATLIPKVDIEAIYDKFRPILADSFDKIEVRSVNEYFKEPPPNYFVTCRRLTEFLLTLQHLYVGKDAMLRLGEVRSQLQELENLHQDYVEDYNRMSDNLQVISKNKDILPYVQKIVSLVSQLLEKLHQMSSSELVAALDRIVNGLLELFQNFLINYLVPLIKEIMSRAVPYPGLICSLNFTAGFLCILFDVVKIKYL